MSSSIDFLHSNSSAETASVTFAIDAVSANMEKKTGVEWYAYHVIQEMKKHVLAPGERVLLFSHEPLRGDLAILPDGWESRMLSWKLPFGWMQGRVSWELWRRPVDVFFVPAQSLPHLLPHRKGIKTSVITTIHDIGFARVAKKYDPAVARLLSRVTKRAIKKATKLMTVSEFTKQEVQDVYHVAEERLVVTPLSADPKVFRTIDQAEINAVLQKHRLGHHYFLTVGRLEHKKNILTLLQAFEAFKKRRGLGDPFELVLVGNEGHGFPEIKRYLDSLSSKASIRLLGYLPDEEVVALMNESTAYIFPSWYEGFGIPNLEAMHCKTALLTSDIPAHHEVAGEAALFIPPNNAEVWAQAMQAIVDDESLRQSLIQKGQERAMLFSWAKTAEKTWKVLRGVTRE